MLKKISLLLFLSSIGCATSIERVIDKTEDKVVKIGMVAPDGHGSCSGVFINKHGEVLTCAHCFRHSGINKIFVKTNDHEVYKATIIRLDLDHDLALLQTDIAQTPYIKIGKSVRKGQQVLSFGSPFGLQGMVTVGWVENIIERGMLYIFHSAFINGGNSGGPLIDLHGKLVGVNEATVMANFLIPANGMYVAIDISVIKEFLKGIQ